MSEVEGAVAKTGCPESLDTLVRDALFEMRKSYAGCLSQNDAAVELAGLADGAADAIERIVRDEVAGKAEAVNDHNDLYPLFPGLSGLFWAYLRVTGAAGLRRALDFMASLRGAVLATALLALPSVWQRGDYPPALIGFLGEVAGREGDTAADIAAHLVGLSTGRGLGN